MVRPELSVIVPLLEETRTLPGFVDSLSGQQGVAFELVLVDGGSADGTPELARELLRRGGLEGRVVAAERGRARQLNRGAAEARAATLLFLHADSRLPEPGALRRGLDALAVRHADRGDSRAAGRFVLRFARSGDDFPAAYAFYEAKARLGRPESIHGDQGFLLSREFFAEVGPFDETLPLLEDTRLAERVRARGEWLLLPDEILTSARRFETEGLVERQTLNALVMNFADQGWERFFAEAPGVYRSQDRAARLRLVPFLELIERLLREAPAAERRRRWRLTGGYVRRHAWQLALALEVRRQWRRGVPPGEMSFRLLAAFDRAWDPLTDHPPGRAAAALLTRLWFRRLRRRRRRLEATFS